MFALVFSYVSLTLKVLFLGKLNQQKRFIDYLITSNTAICHGMGSYGK